MSVHDAAAEREAKRLLGIPDDEPIFVLRAKDRLGIRAVEDYCDSADEAQTLGMEATPEWRGNLGTVLNDFRMFAVNNPDRMKFPD